MPDVTKQTRHGVPYVSKAYHRNGNANKSQWKAAVTVAAEVTIFECSFKEGETTVWGYFVISGTAAPLGTSASASPPVVDLLIAKFNGQENPVVWSGYPANYRINAQDRPPTSVLKEWQTAGVIAKHEISRIRGGKKCALSR